MEGEQAPIDVLPVLRQKIKSWLSPTMWGISREWL